MWIGRLGADARVPSLDAANIYVKEEMRLQFWLRAICGNPAVAGVV